MAEPYYHITHPGAEYAVCDNESTEHRVFLLSLVKNFACQPFSLTEIKAYFGNDNRQALKTIYHAINKGWIDIDENTATAVEPPEQHDLASLVDRLSNTRLVLSDYSGFPVTYAGYNKYDAECISALSCAYMRNALQSRRLSGQAPSQPLSFKLDWQASVLLGQVWHIGQIRLCISLADHEMLKHDDLFQLMLLLTRRYYEQ